MQYVKNHKLKALLNFCFLFYLTCFSQINNISATESQLWIANDIEGETSIITAFNTQKNEGFHLFSHGKSGELLLEGEWKNAEQIAIWLKQHEAIQQQKYLNVYGCEFAKGHKGKAAVQYLEETLGLCVAASDDITGIDGDWELEVGSTTNLVVKNYHFNLQACNCSEYVYLNEITENNNAVHKFLVNSDGSFTEIGNPWFDNVAAGETLTDPHGLGSDLNGFLYIGETALGNVRKFTCDGTIFSSSDFEINSGGLNFVSIGNTLLVNPFDASFFAGNNSANDGIYAYDLCIAR